MRPRITIVTPSFNQARFLEATLRSVLDQRYENLEYVVVDGGSTDGSRDILERFRSRLSRLVIERDEGQSDALRKGFARATGAILAWLNSDDCLAPGSLVAVADFFSANPSIDVVHGNFVLVDANGAVIREVATIGMHYPTLVFENPALAQPATFWRREIYDRVGGVDPSLRFCMDLDLWVRMYGAGARFHRLDRTLANFRMHGAAKTATIQAVNLAERAQIQRRALGRELSHAERRILPILLRLRRLAIQFTLHPAGMTRSWWRRISQATPSNAAHN